MTVGLVRNAAFGMVAIVGLGLAACDDNPTDFEADDTVSIQTNPSVMTVAAGETRLLESRTENPGREATWEEITATVDASCGAGAVSIAEAASFQPLIQPPGVFDVTGGTTWGETCIQLSGGGASATVEVFVVADSLEITGAPDTLNLNQTAQLTAALLSGDGSAVGPFDQTTDLVWSSDNPAAISVEQTGVITSEGPGIAVISAVWTEFGVSVSASTPPIETGELPTLEIVGAPDTLDIFTTVDLSASFTNPPSFDFGPFDPDTDVVWSSSDEDELTVDPGTGVVEAVGPTGATITATWTGNENITASVDIAVFVTPPNLDSTDMATADPLDVVTITGTGLIPGVHTVFINGAEPLGFYPTEVVDAMTATFTMPAGAAAEVLDITVGVEGIPSNTLNVTRTCGTFTDCPTEPGNDDQGTAPIVVVPFSATGIVDGEDLDDFYRFDLAAETTIQIDLSWTGDSGDLDLLVVDEPFTGFQCGFVTATGNVPESGECTLPAGSYAFQVNSFDEEGASYQLDVTLP